MDLPVPNLLSLSSNLLASPVVILIDIVIIIISLISIGISIWKLIKSRPQNNSNITVSSLNEAGVASNVIQQSKILPLLTEEVLPNFNSGSVLDNSEVRPKSIEAINTQIINSSKVSNERRDSTASNDLELNNPKIIPEPTEPNQHQRLNNNEYLTLNLTHHNHKNSSIESGEQNLNNLSVTNENRDRTLSMESGDLTLNNSNNLNPTSDDLNRKSSIIENNSGYLAIPSTHHKNNPSSDSINLTLDNPRVTDNDLFIGRAELESNDNPNQNSSITENNNKYLEIPSTHHKNTPSTDSINLTLDNPRVTDNDLFIGRSELESNDNPNPNPSITENNSKYLPIPPTHHKNTPSTDSVNLTLDNLRVTDNDLFIGEAELNEKEMESKTEDELIVKDINDVENTKNPINLNIPKVKSSNSLDFGNIEIKPKSKKPISNIIRNPNMSPRSVRLTMSQNSQNSQNSQTSQNSQNSQTSQNSQNSDNSKLVQENIDNNKPSEKYLEPARSSNNTGNASDSLSLNNPSVTNELE